MVNYTSQAIDVPQFRVDDGPSSVELTANFAHPANNLSEGSVRFHVQSNDIQVTRLHTLQQAKPGLDGVIRLAADGAATLRGKAAPLFSTLNANLSASRLSMNKKALGDMTATAVTHGSAVDFNLNSNFARSTIKGSGRLGLAGEYPLTAQVSIANLTYAGLSPLLGGPLRPFDGTVNGQMEVSGPVTDTDNFRGSVTLTTLEAHSVTTPKGKAPRVKFELHNTGNILLALGSFRGHRADTSKSPDRTPT